MKVTIISAAMLITMVIGGCGSSSGAPQAIIDAAINNVKESCVNKYTNHTKECGEPTITGSKKVDPTPAQKQMGFSNVYNVGVEYAFKPSSGSNWQNNKACIIVHKKDGNLSSKMTWYHECKLDR